MQPVAKGFILSIQQNRLCFVKGKSSAYQAFCQIRIEGRLNLEIFQRAFSSVVAHHAILRTQLRSISGIDVPIQVISDTEEFDSYLLVSLEGMELSQQKEQVAEYVKRMQERPLDLEHSIFLNWVLLRLSQTSYIFLISLPAFCADAATLKLFVVELARVYSALIEGAELFSEEPMEYVDVSAWQNELLKDEDAEEQKAFWRKFDLSLLATLFLPFQHHAFYFPDTRLEPFIYEEFTLSYGAQYTSCIDALVRKNDVSVEAFWLACWLTTIWRVTDQRTVLLGVESDGRYYEELSGALGPYSSVIPFSISLTEVLPFERLLVLVYSLLSGAKRQQIYFSWEDASEQYSNSKPSFQYFPLGFAYEQWPATIESSSVHFSMEKSISCIEPFAIKIYILQLNNDFTVRLCYNPRCVSYEHIHRLGKSFDTLLSEGLVHPDAFVSALPILPLLDQQDLQQRFTAPAPPTPFQTLIEAFEKQVELYPEGVAVVCEDEYITYVCLNTQADHLASTLQSAGVSSNVLVGLYMERSIHMLVGMLAIFKSGGGYVPFDLDQPVARLRQQIQDLHMPVILTQMHVRDSLIFWDGMTLCLDDPQTWTVNEGTLDVLRLGGSEDLAYVLYTSGSTGTPKGVMIRHKSVINYTVALCELLALQAGFRFATVSTLSADLGNTAIFCSLASGGCLHILRYETVTSGKAFASYMEKNSIDVLKIVPSHLSALLASYEKEAVFPRRYLILGGEALSFSLLYRLQEMQCGACIINHYGPTEATIGALVNVVGKLGRDLWIHADKHEALTVPIGLPIAGMGAYILDQQQQIVSVGITGELYLGGVGLAVGYLGQPEQTQEHFVAHPWSKDPDALLYRTGDLARYSDDGSVEFVGRVDSQVKLRGYRIELGELEIILKKHAEVRECVVVLREDVPGDKHLVAYIVARHLSFDEEAFRRFMQEYVPEYMLPSFFVFLRILPLNANGKVDYRALPLPVKEHYTYVAPQTPIEELLVTIWESVLHVKQISVYDTFFSLGGHSLLATLIISRIHQALRIDIPLRTLFEAPTVADLAERIEQLVRGKQTREVPPMKRVSRDQVLLLSFAQQRLWFLYQLEPRSFAYNISMTVKLEGALNIPVLVYSLNEIVRRHETLRTTFHAQGGTPFQVIHPASTYCMPIVDLRRIAPDVHNAQIQSLSQQNAQRICSLEQGPLMHVMLLWIDSNEYILLYYVHHIISDAWSKNIFTYELITLYNSFLVGHVAPLPDLPLQYADFACWQRRWLQDENLQSLLDYWTSQLDDISPLEFPTDRPYPAVQTFNGAQVRLLLPATLSEAMRQLSQREGTTLFMTLLAAFYMLLAYYSDQDDIVVGTPIANRSQSETERLIGFFTNTLVMRANMAGNPTFREVLAQIRKVALDAYAHQELPFEKLVEVLRPERNMSHSPLFRIMFQLQHASSASTEVFKNVNVQVLGQASTTAKFDFTLSIVDTDQGMSNTVEYNTDLFNESTMVLLLERWRHLLEMLIGNPDQRLAELSLLTEPERLQVVVEWNLTQDTEFPQVCIHTLVDAYVCSAPDAIAAVYLDDYITYQKLNYQAKQLAHYIQKLGVKQEVTVGICMERSLLMLVSILGVLNAGGVYVPLDPEYPPDRLAFMLHDANVSVLLTQQMFLPIFPASARKTVLLDSDWEAIAHESAENLAVPMHTDQLLYVIYTSGSTGKPKGIGLSHRALANLLFWHNANVAPAARTLQFASLSFDVCSFEIFATWCSGGTLFLLSSLLRRDVVGLVQFLARMAIEKAILPVLILQQLAEYYWSHNQTIVYLQELIATGEQLQITPYVAEFFQRVKHCNLHNYYGPSESHVVTAHTLSGVPLSWPARPPIGRPIANTQIYVLNRFHKPVPIGVPGELYVGGVSLARGYFNRPEQTAERFVPDPFSAVPGGRLYKTGDRARYLLDGTIEYLGRFDLQVKIRGYRVELAEIESVLNQYPGVRDTVVHARATGVGDKQLVAYIVCDTSSSPRENQDWRRFLHQKLPEYMIPSTFVSLNSLPLTVNGKVDHHILQSMPIQTVVEAGSGFVAPRTSAEEILVQIWQEVLDKPVGVYDNFFEIGGHSLLATQVVARVGAAFQIELPIRSLFEAPTIYGLIGEIANMRGGREAVEEIAQIFQEIVALAEDEVKP